MEIIRLTDSQRIISDRQVYHLLEHLDTFSLLECREKDSVCLSGATDTLILDHFDQAENPSAILRQVFAASSEIQRLILVDSNPLFGIDVPSQYECKLHIALGPKQGLPSGIAVTHIDDLEAAVRLLKSGLTRAA